MNIGIIGAGGIARKLHLPQLAKVGGVQVTHIAGRKVSRLKALAEQYSIPNWTTDADALLNDSSIDGIIVALPHPMHVPVGVRALQAGKHVLMQKPLCADMLEANAFVEAAENTDRIAYVLPNFGADIYAIRKELAASAIGKLSGAYCRVSHGGPEVYYAEIRDYFGEEGDDLWFFKPGEASVGALFDMGVYAVSVLVATMGSVKSVSGNIATVDKPTELEDTATLLLKFDSGALGTAETGWCDPARSFALSIHGTRGKLTNSGPNGAGLTRWEPGSYTREDEPARPYPVDLAGHDHGNAHDQWLRCVAAGKQPEISNAATARHVTEILLAGLESARTGSAVPVNSRL